MTQESAKLLSNPRIIGPGVWYSIHLLAKNAVDPESKEDFIEYMDELAENFPCAKCRKHIQEYLSQNPFRPFYHLEGPEEEDIGFFKWSWIFHNSVNARLEKPMLEFGTAYSMYYDPESQICDHDCDEPKNTKENAEKNTKENTEKNAEKNIEENTEIQNDYDAYSGSEEEEQLGQRSINWASDNTNISLPIFNNPDFV